MSSKNRKFGCGGIFLIVILLFFSGILIYSLFITSKSFLVYSWPQVEAEILFSNTESSSSSTNTTFRTISEYKYQFEGKQYSNDGLAVGYGFNDNVENNGEIRQLLEEGVLVKAYVNPGEPQEAYLVAGLHHSIVFALIFTLMFGTLISFFVVPILTNGRVNMRKLLWLLIIIWAGGVIYLLNRPFDISIANKIEVIERSEQGNNSIMNQ